MFIWYMSHMESWRLIDDMNSLQVVMTYATDYQYRLRCLPWFLPKKYMNTHIFDGVHIPDYKINEIYIGHKSIILADQWNPPPREQLYALFQTYGIPQTFDYLTDISKASATSFLVHKNMYDAVQARDPLAFAANNSINDLIHDCFSDNKNNTLPEIITGTTYALLQGMSVFMKKKN